MSCKDVYRNFSTPRKRSTRMRIKNREWS